MILAFPICLVDITGFDYQQLGDFVSMTLPFALPVYDVIVMGSCWPGLFIPAFELQFEPPIIKCPV